MINCEEPDGCDNPATFLVYEPPSISLDWPLVCEAHADQLLADNPEYIKSPLDSTNKEN